MLSCRMISSCLVVPPDGKLAVELSGGDVARAFVELAEGLDQPAGQHVPDPRREQGPEDEKAPEQHRARQPAPEGEQEGGGDEQRLDLAVFAALLLLVLRFGLLLRLFQLAPDGRGFLAAQVFSGKLPEGRCNHIGVPALEEHQVTGMLAGSVLLQRKIQAVLLRRGRKGPDILIRDLDVGNAGVVLHKLPEGLLSVVQLGLVAGHSFLHLVQHFFHGLLQHSGGELGGLHTEGNGALGDFFLHKSSSPFSAAVQVVVHQGRIVAVDGGRGVIQGR